MPNLSTLIVLYVFVGVVTGSLIDKMPSLEDSDKASGICYQPGQVICSNDCKGLSICIREDNYWLQIEIENCTDGYYCNDLNRTCTPSLSTCSPTNPPVYQLQCHDGGRFPDPFDCTVYHECDSIGSPSKVVACEDGWSYNALDTNCDHSLSEDLCFPAGRVPACTSPGQSGPFPENLNIYYICLQSTIGNDTELLPELFKCDHGGIFIDGECLPITY